MAAIPPHRIRSEDDIKPPLSPNYPSGERHFSLFSGMSVWAYEMVRWDPQMARLVHGHGKDLQAYEKDLLGHYSSSHNG